MFKVSAFAFVLLGLTGAVTAAQPLGLGQPARPADLVRAAISVAPDGTGLPRGRGTAKDGRGVYDAQCAACHGAKGEGSAAFPKLVGGIGSLATAQPVGTIGSFWPYATTVWDYINRAMPYQNPGSLKADEVYGVTAYLLYLNGIVGESTELNRYSLPKVEMPNRAGFVDDARPDVK